MQWCRWHEIQGVEACMQGNSIKQMEVRRVPPAALHAHGSALQFEAEPFEALKLLASPPGLVQISARIQDLDQPNPVADGKDQ